MGQRHGLGEYCQTHRDDSQVKQKSNTDVEQIHQGQEEELRQWEVEAGKKMEKVEGHNLEEEIGRSRRYAGQLPHRCRS